MSSVTISDAPLSIEDLVAVADGEPVELAAAARARIEASRAVVDIAMASGDAIYGVTTHVGHGKDVRLSEDELRRQQETLVMTHAGGVGLPLKTRRVRAAWSPASTAWPAAGPAPVWPRPMRWPAC